MEPWLPPMHNDNGKDDDGDDDDDDDDDGDGGDGLISLICLSSWKNLLKHRSFLKGLSNKR